MKKRLTQNEEFQIMLLVLDKFLWLGFGIMAYGLYREFVIEATSDGIWWMLAGAAILATFLVLIIKEYEIIKT